MNVGFLIAQILIDVASEQKRNNLDNTKTNFDNKQQKQNNNFTHKNTYQRQLFKQQQKYNSNNNHNKNKAIKSATKNNINNK